MTVPSNQKTSILVPYQLPAYIREDPSYTNFVLFVQAYYEWLEQQGNVTDGVKNILNYMDIDNTTSQFLDYFTKDFLAFFPKEMLANKNEVVKLAKQLYQSKGTPASYKLLFRILYNTDVDFFYTKDAVLKASAGTWYVPRSLKLNTLDPNFLVTQNLRVFGETTKSIATIETATVATGSKTEVFISNVERLFNSGEFVRVVDSNNQDVYFLNEKIVPSSTEGSYVLRAKIVGQISQIKIDPNNRGLTYFNGDPVVVYGGLSTPTGHGATAQIGDTTSGSIQRINIINSGYGYTPSANPGYAGNANTQIAFSALNPGAKAPIATVGGLNTSQPANATMIPINNIGLKQNIVIGNTNYGFANLAVSNANTTLVNAFSFTTFTTYPLSSVLVQNGGGGLQVIPTITPVSLYNEEYSIPGILVGQGNLGRLGILAPITIINGGSGYSVNNQIIFTGGSGVGAFANVTGVDANGSITQVSYVYPPSGVTTSYPLGGFAYELSLPTLSVSGAGSNAVLQVTSTLGTGAVLTPITDRIGSITSINIIDNGQDYVAAPNVSFRVEDLLVTNVAPNNLAVTGDIVYQGTSAANSTYLATVDSIFAEVPNVTANGIYSLRVYNYNAAPNPLLPLKIDSRKLSMVLTSSYTPPTWAADSRFKANTTPYMLVYGDGNAQGTVKFLNGLVIGSGQYLDTSGQPSSFDVLQSVDYNNYTYELTLEKEIAQYRDTLLNLLHPTGMKVIGRMAMKSNNDVEFAMIDSLSTGNLLSDFASSNAYAVMSADYTNQSNNIVYFNALGGANLASFITTSSTLELITANGDIVFSQVSSVNSSANTVTLKDNVWLTFANVANITGLAGSNAINIRSLTGSYNIVNGGVYSNTAYPLIDIVKAYEDHISIANNASLAVKSVDYLHNIIYTTSNLTNNSNSLMTVTRTLTATAQNVRIYNTPGIPYLAEILTEANLILVTENGSDIILIH